MSRIHDEQLVLHGMGPSSEDFGIHVVLLIQQGSPIFLAHSELASLSLFPSDYLQKESLPRPKNKKPQYWNQKKTPAARATPNHIHICMNI